MLHAFLPTSRQAEQITTTDTADVGTKRQRFDNMISASHAAVTNYLELVAQRIRNRGDAVNRCRCGLELTPAMIRQHDRCRSGIDGLAGITDSLNTLDHQRAIPLAGKPFDILPVD